GLDLAKAIVDPAAFERLQEKLRVRREVAAATPIVKAAPAPKAETIRSSLVPILAKPPIPPDFDRHVLRNTPIDRIWQFINPMMLYGRHLGIRGGIVRELEKVTSSLLREIEEKDPKAASVYRAVEEVKQEYRGTDLLAPSAVYRFLRAGSRGNHV